MLSNKLKNINNKIDEDVYLNLFDCSTILREDLYSFAYKEISGNELIKLLYDKQTKEIIKFWIKKYGVKKVRNKLKSIYKKFTDNGMPKFI